MAFTISSLLISDKNWRILQRETIRLEKKTEFAVVQQSLLLYVGRVGTWLRTEKKKKASEDKHMNLCPFPSSSSDMSLPPPLPFSCGKKSKEKQEEIPPTLANCSFSSELCPQKRRRILRQKSRYALFILLSRRPTKRGGGKNTAPTENTAASRGRKKDIRTRKTQ